MVINLAEIYRQLVSLTARVEASLARQEHLDRIIADHETELRPLVGAHEKIIDHETRLRVIERSRWPLASVTILVAVAAAVIGLAGLLTR